MGVRWPRRAAESSSGEFRDRAWPTLGALLRLDFMRCTCLFAATIALSFGPSGAAAEVLVDETFDDAALSDRGWYDVTAVDIATEGCAAGSCLRYHYAPGDVTPSGRGTLRIQFAPTEVVYLRYMTRYSDDWAFRERYGPHELYFTTNEDDRWVGPAETHLTVYVEHVEGVGRISAQDTRNVDQSRIGEDLTAATEARGVHGCNGDPDGYGAGDCYRAGDLYRNGRGLGRTTDAVFTSASGPRFQGDWHEVVVEIRLNTVGDGVTHADGVARYLFDGELQFEVEDLVFRTSENRDMAFEQFLIGPYFHDGAPHAQDWFVDELTIASTPEEVGLDATSPTPADPPSTATSDGGAPIADEPDASGESPSGAADAAMGAAPEGGAGPESEVTGGCSVSPSGSAPPWGALAFILLIALTFLRSSVAAKVTVPVDHADEVRPTR